MIPEDKNGGSKPNEPGEVDVTVVDRRHHAPDAAGSEESVTDDARSPYPSFIEELKARAETAEKEARDALVRSRTEIDAVRARLQRDVDRRVDEGRSRLLTAILGVVDNLERAGEVAAAEEAIAQGIELVRQQILGILKAEGVEPIEMVGREYDPNLAEAVGLHEVDDEAQDNIVLDEIQKGYLLGEKVLRPARVRVGKSRA